MKERNVVLMLMLMCAVLSSPLFAVTLPGPNEGRGTVEAAVPGSVYLDFVDNPGGYSNGGLNLTLTGDVSGWAYPDDSNDDVFVHGNCFDNKSGVPKYTSVDFTATISGLDAGEEYRVYMMVMISQNYAWGFNSPPENDVIGGDLLDANFPTDGAILISNPITGGGSGLRLLRAELFMATGTGEIVLQIGPHLIPPGGSYNQDRGQLDGLLVKLVDITFNPPPNVDAGPDFTVWTDALPIKLAGSATDVGPEDGTSPGSPGGVVSSYWYSDPNNPGDVTFEPADTTLVYEPNVTAFSVPGTYNLVLQVSDGLVDGNDIVTITVWDAALKAKVAHWDMENIVDSNIPELVADNHGTYGTYVLIPPEPDAILVEITPHVVPGVIGDDAIRFYNDPNHMLNPFSLPRVTGTLSHWCKIGRTQAQVIYYEGNEASNGWGGPTLEIHSGSTGGEWMFFWQDSLLASVDVKGGESVVGEWSHVVATWNILGDLILYDNGVEVARDAMGRAGGGNLPPLAECVIVGGVSDLNASGEDRMYNGDLDDVRVYNYALTPEEIRALTGVVELKAKVDAGPDASYQLSPGEAVSTAGIVTDYGIPGTLDLKWTTLIGPEDANAVFVDPNSAVTDVTFPVFGAYQLQLEVYDENLDEITDTDIVWLTIISPVCQDVIDGLDGAELYPGDISGPDGTPDCRVDLQDIAAFAAEFLRCNNPETLGCEDPWSL